MCRDWNLSCVWRIFGDSAQSARLAPPTKARDQEYQLEGLIDGAMFGVVRTGA
jgi:hypothetical protein